MSTLHPRLRDLVHPDEWALIEQGLCPNGGPRDRCLKPLVADSVWGYCIDHETQAPFEAPQTSKEKP